MDWVGGDPLASPLSLAGSSASTVGSRRSHVSGSATSFMQEVTVTTVMLGLEELIHGCNKAIKIPVNVRCEACKGRGHVFVRSAGGGGGGDAEQCGGFSVNDDGTIASPSTRSGSDHYYLVADRVACEQCRTRGSFTVQQKRELKLPPGVRDGYTYKVPDLPASVMFMCDLPPGVSRRDDDLCMTIDISLTEMLVGYSRALVLPYKSAKTVDVSVPGVIQEGCHWMVRGAGLPNQLRPERRGDLVLDFCIRYPRVGLCQEDVRRLLSDTPAKPLTARNVVAITPEVYDRWKVEE